MFKLYTVCLFMLLNGCATCNHRDHAPARVNEFRTCGPGERCAE